MKEDGWVVCWRGEQNIFQKSYDGKKVRVVIYVDDFIAAGPPKQLAQSWKELGMLFDLDPNEDLSRFLGVHHSVKEMAPHTDGKRKWQVRMSQP